MRTLLTLRSSTKAERRFSEVLKRLRIPFQHRVKIGKREVDFIVGNYAIDIDGHTQDVNKNIMLITKGYNPIHFSNNSIPNPYLEEWLTKIYYGSRNRISSSAPNNCKSLGTRD